MSQRFATRLGACLLTLCLAPAGFTQQPAQEMRNEIEALKRGQQQLQKELQEIRRLLQARQATPLAATPSVWNQVFDLSAKPIKGETTAKLTVVEFTDYQ